MVFGRGLLPDDFVVADSGGKAGMKPSVNVPNARCPHCGCAQDMAAGTAYYPESGDVSLCIQCAGVSVLRVAGRKGKGGKR